MEKYRLLFVDDEPNVLQGLKRMLFKMKDQWDMQFASGGKEALEILEKSRIQVIITDMLMPGMNGLELLKEVCSSYPKVFRVVLSGHSEHGMLVEAAKLAHQFLTKPCNADTVVETIEQALKFRQILHNEEAKRIVSRISMLPTMPVTFQRISDEMANPDYSVAAIARIVAEDSSMSANILKLVNSSFFGLINRITSPEKAIALLGADTIKSFIVNEHIFTEIKTGQIKYFNLDLLRNHTLLAARLSKTISKLIGQSKQYTDMSSIAGLLHDIGKVVLITNFNKTYKVVVEEARAQNKSIWEMEKEIIGTSHAEVGAYLLSLWGFDEEVIQAVHLHHCPNLSVDEGTSVLTSVYLGNVLEHRLVKLNENYAVRPLDDIYVGRMNLTGKMAEIENTCRKICMEVYGE
ncbi:HDOD domain-containing protein [Geovibrio thiophilus]|uniref:HDOD domain-containing protein n=1 Tax=Geovibrio thiophilus TaxID=139438 RepID=A0A3R5UVM9_9BACT|nr:response regulator [Geovibrio thiophilus]QAR33809.1 HDOD domain-containing protein [Geovibrio thiophilus]